MLVSIIVLLGRLERFLNAGEFTLPADEFHLLSFFRVGSVPVSLETAECALPCLRHHGRPVHRRARVPPPRTDQGKLSQVPVDARRPHSAEGRYHSCQHSGIHAKWKEVLMASTEEYLAYALDLLREAPVVTYRKMMGEYLLYSKGIIIGGIYDDRLLLKDVPAARKSFPCENIPYEGAKPMLLVDSDDPALIAATVAAMLPQLPPPKRTERHPLTLP